MPSDYGMQWRVLTGKGQHQRAARTNGGVGKDTRDPEGCRRDRRWAGATGLGKRVTGACLAHISTYLADNPSYGNHSPPSELLDATGATEASWPTYHVSIHLKWSMYTDLSISGPWNGKTYLHSRHGLDEPFYDSGHPLETG